MWNGALVAHTPSVWEDLGSIPGQDGIFLETLISLLLDNRLKNYQIMWCHVETTTTKKKKKKKDNNKQVSYSYKLPYR